VTGAATVLLADVAPKVFTVDTGSFLAIVVTGAVAGTVAAVAGGRGLFLPVVVLELVLGVVIGPQGLDIAHVNDFTQFFSDLGLGMLFFFAGYEIDIPRIRGRPLRLALFGWAMSLTVPAVTPPPSSSSTETSDAGPRLLDITTGRPARIAIWAIALPIRPAPMIPMLWLSTGCITVLPRTRRRTDS
jgi:hypothetical protein